MFIQYKVIKLLYKKTEDGEEFTSLGWNEKVTSWDGG